MVARDWQTAHFLWLWAASRSGLDMASMSRARLEAWSAGQTDARQRVAATRRVALLQFHAGRRDEALALYHRALEDAERKFGQEAAETAACLADLAESLRVDGHLAEAESLARRALAIREKTLGPAGRLTRAARAELGRILIAREDWKSALPVWRRAVAIAEQDLVVDPAIGEATGNLGLVLEKVGDAAGAERYQRQAVAFLERVYGRQNAETARAISNLGILLARTDRAEEGEALVREALAIGTETTDYRQTLLVSAVATSRTTTWRLWYPCRPMPRPP
jgi:tetratricopeptide (TPR) repeat protein